MSMTNDHNSRRDFVNPARPPVQGCSDSEAGNRARIAGQLRPDGRPDRLRAAAARHLPAFSRRTNSPGSPRSATSIDDQLQAASKKFSGAKTFQNYKELLASDVDAVYIATPPYLHPEHFEAAVAAKKHIFMEKPAGVDAAGLQARARRGEQGRQDQAHLGRLPAALWHGLQRKAYDNCEVGRIGRDRDDSRVRGSAAVCRFAKATRPRRRRCGTGSSTAKTRATSSWSRTATTSTS